MPDGTDLQRLTTGFDPAYSASGRLLAFSRWQLEHPGTADIWVMNSDGSGERQLTALGDAPNRSEASDPSISSSLARVAFSLSRRGETEVYTVRLDGTHARRLTAARAFDGNPVFSPAGNRILWVRTSRDFSESSLWVMRANGGHKKRLMKDFAIWDVDWSPGGERIAYTNSGRLKLIRADGTFVRTVAAGVPSHTDVSWSPDGRRIAIARNRREGGSVTAYSRDGTEQVSIDFGAAIDDVEGFVNGVAWQPEPL